MLIQYDPSNKDAHNTFILNIFLVEYFKLVLDLNWFKMKLYESNYTALLPGNNRKLRFKDF